jgi:hypothetical protein
LRGHLVGVFLPPERLGEKPDELKLEDVEDEFSPNGDELSSEELPNTEPTGEGVSGFVRDSNGFAAGVDGDAAPYAKVDGAGDPNGFSAKEGDGGAEDPKDEVETLPFPKPLKDGAGCVRAASSAETRS